VARTMNESRGFTLVEVMVALAVVAIALPALMISLNQQIEGTAYIRDKSLAHMVAASKLAETRILADARQSLLKGKDSGTATQSEREWYWSLESTSTEVPEFYRIEIRIAASEAQIDNPLYTLVAFLSADLRTEIEAVAPDVPDV
jgi:general secretion pathway protein I